MSQNRTTIINTALRRVGAQGVNLAFQDTPGSAGGRGSDPANSVFT